MSEPGSAPGRHSAVVAGWSRAEAALSGTLQYDPAGYQAAIAAMADVLDHLRSTWTDPERLAEAEHDDAVLAIARARPTGAVDPATTVAAALAVRHRELVYQAQLARRRSAMSRAVAAGRDWVELVDDAALGTRQELHVHLATGLGVISSAQFDLDTGTPVFVARTVRVDPATGAVVGPADEVGGERLADHRGDLDRNIAELVAAIEAVDSDERVE